MPLSFSICNGCNCTPKEMQTPKLNIGIRTKKWAVAHGLHIPDNSIPPGLPASSSNDKKISADLANPNNIFIIVTDIPNIDKVLNTYLQGAHASIFVLRPTLNHMALIPPAPAVQEMSVRYATSILRPGDRCTMWCK
ncbi:hypothetical protein FRB98_004403 [Tulasnella sp. 332]|nr:hypothetical protein FRB98_004403 [Tulasnella sp. 332]